MHAKDKALTRSTILGKTDRELSADPTVYTVLSFGLVKAREKGSYLEGSRDRTEGSRDRTLVSLCIWYSKQM